MHAPDCLRTFESTPTKLNRAANDATGYSTGSTLHGAEGSGRGFTTCAPQTPHEAPMAPSPGGFGLKSCIHGSSETWRMAAVLESGTEAARAKPPAPAPHRKQHICCASLVFHFKTTASRLDHLAIKRQKSHPQQCWEVHKQHKPYTRLQGVG